MDTNELLAKVSAVALKERFIEEYSADATDAKLREALGVAIGTYCKWDGRKICEIFGYALEEANFHSKASYIREWFA